MVPGFLWAPLTGPYQLQVTTGNYNPPYNYTKWAWRMFITPSAISPYTFRNRFFLTLHLFIKRRNMREDKFPRDFSPLSVSPLSLYSS